MDNQNILIRGTKIGLQALRIVRLTNNRGFPVYKGQRIPPFKGSINQLGTHLFIGAGQGISYFSLRSLN